jgi:hypothetical protein
MKAGHARISVKALLVAVVLVAAVCIGAGWAGTPAASATGSCPTHGRVVCVDRSDGGHSVQVRVGQIVKVELEGTTLRWSGLRQVGPRLLRAEGPVDQRAEGISASYAAVKAGRTTLRASAAPKCSRGRACPQFILLWQVRMVIIG